MTKTLRTLQTKNPEKISGWYKDTDGYWIDLQPGWQWQECHSVHEWNVKDAVQSFRDVEPCDCPDCASRKVNERIAAIRADVLACLPHPRENRT